MANEGASPLGASGMLIGLPKRASRRVLMALIAAKIDASPAKARGARHQAPGAREIPTC